VSSDPRRYAHVTQTRKENRVSNLGSYQDMTTLAKKVGGPVVLAVITAVGGYLVGRTGELGVVTGVKQVARKVRTANTKRARKIAALPLFVVHTEADCGGGLTVNQGQQFRVIGRDGDMAEVMIVDDENPYHVVSAELLARISDYSAT
jgi:hypothetical protein